MDRQAVSRWERGTHRPRPYYVRLLSALYEASPTDLGLVDAVEERRVIHDFDASRSGEARRRGSPRATLGVGSGDPGRLQPGISSELQSVIEGEQQGLGARRRTSSDRSGPAASERRSSAGPDIRTGSTDRSLDDAVELMEAISGSDSIPHIVGLLEGSVSRLRRSYSKTPPNELAAAIHDRLHIVKHVLGYGLSRSHRRDVEASATWLTLLLATAYFDLGRSELAWVYRDVALQVANDLGHQELEAWAWETPAWFALMSRDYRDAVELCEHGQSTAPHTSVRIAVHMQEARARARLGEHAETINAIRRAQDASDRVPAAAHLDDHYTFDPSKIDFYAATAFLYLGDYREAERHARNVILASSDPTGENYWPTRVGSARMDLGMALDRRGAVDVATYEASQAFDSPFVRRSTLARGYELAGIVRDYSDVPEVREFLDRLRCTGVSRTGEHP